ncbi:MAG: hypothetical protein A3I73_05995 [Omnitrophica bacterium RIFCSPLOWO2_02_FULL_45_16]|nr:MAG: hypothetical protein A3C51_01700 [Omnitrophica bacterium RIFCSPHIGHO2_02_FULL_46_20]OGX01105.1 MAG: hypothetical protein A3I73_05995 [Omnitrophica bacterium RIFCSPLOWO2_02_FULL_45_16]
MRILSLALAIALILAFAPGAYCADDYENDSDSSNESSTSTDTISGGIFGKNNSTPYRSIPNDGEENARAIDIGITSKKASDKIGQGPILGATGTGVLARALMSTDQQRREEEQKQRQEKNQEQEVQDYQRAPKNVPINAKIKRKIKRRYDDEGNLIEESANR